ncbi:hypothetical protein QAD02_014984 [Eretmocerus hayati]|uniref:Uncharacterized protein n=1 Tax=Eretmocerus hayati TaxID=131215 RepID=A0ACC2P9R9_9HYME|nr:hypothetical protein QAD02_014984 [Eretmocerus hayati]
MNQGYARGSSKNLPNVNLKMLIMFFTQNGCFSSPELKNVKSIRNMHSNYGDQAVGYVQILRQQYHCTVEAKVCPEHTINTKNYNVIVRIDEQEEIISKAECQDCTASQGGCKHAVAFIAWLYRKSQEPPPTSVACYWKKPMLSRVDAKVNHTTMEDLLSSASKHFNGRNRSDEFLKLVLSSKESQSSEGHLFKLHLILYKNSLCAIYQ